MRRRALQRVDPIGALAGRALTATAALGVVVLAVGGAIVSLPFAVHPAGVVVAATVFLVAAIALATVVARAQGPIERGPAIGIILLGVIGLLAGIWSVGDAQIPGTVWAGYPTSILILALVPYRPAPETLLVTLGVAMVGVVAVSLAAPQGVFGLPGYRQIAMFLSIAALPLGGVAFTTHVLGFLEGSRRGLLASATSAARDQETDIIRTVQQTRVTVLNQDVVPFFADVVAKGRIDAADRDRARVLAESIRSIMVADIDRSWLAQFVTERRTAGRAGSSYALTDRQGRAQRMDLDQRAALRALIDRLEAASGSAPVDCVLELTGTDFAVDVTLIAALGVPRREARVLLDPYLAVIGAVFSDVRFVFRADSLTLRFSL